MPSRYEVVLRAVGRDRLAIAPMLGQVETQVQFNQLALCGLEFVETDMPAVDERQHVRGHVRVEVSSSLSRPEIAAHRENRQQVALRGLTNLRIAARERPKVSREMCPVLDVREDVQHVACRQSGIEALLECDGARRNFLRDGLTQNRLAVAIDHDVFALVRQLFVELAGGIGEPLSQVPHEVAAARRQTELVAVLLRLQFALSPRQEVITIVGVGIRAGHAQVPDAQLFRHVRQHAQLEITTIGRRPVAMRTPHKLALPRRRETDVDVGVNPLPVQRFVFEHDVERFKKRADPGWSNSTPRHARRAS